MHHLSGHQDSHRATALHFSCGWMQKGKLCFRSWKTSPSPVRINKYISWHISVHTLNSDKAWVLLPSMTLCPKLAAEIKTDFLLCSFGFQTVLTVPLLSPYLLLMASHLDKELVLFLLNWVCHFHLPPESSEARLKITSVPIWQAQCSVFTLLRMERKVLINDCHLPFQLLTQELQ